MNQYPGHEHNDEVDLAFAMAEIGPAILNRLQPEQKIVEQTDMASYTLIQSSVTYS